MKYKLKEHVTDEMLGKAVKGMGFVRLNCNNGICHIPEMLNAEYDIWFNFHTKEVEDYGLDDDGLFDKLLELGYVEVVE